MRRAADVLARFFGTGNLPWAPGTWASAAALPLFWILLPWPVLHVLTLAVLTAVGVPACTVAERQAGERDPNFVVLNEVAGMGTALLFVPRDPFLALVAFLLFRLFDIWKPYPIRGLQDLPGGWGIMLDDLLAGAYACGCVHLAMFVMRQIA